METKLTSRDYEQGEDTDRILGKLTFSSFFLKNHRGQLQILVETLSRCFCLSAAAAASAFIAKERATADSSV